MAFIDTALKLLAKKGFLITLNNYSNSSFDIDSGEYIKAVSETVDTNAIYSKFEAMEYDTFAIQQGDKKLILAVENFNLNVATRIIIEGIKYSIADIKEVKDGLSTVIYKLIIRVDKEA